MSVLPFCTALYSLYVSVTVTRDGFVPLCDLNTFKRVISDTPQELFVN